MISCGISNKSIFGFLYGLSFFLASLYSFYFFGIPVLTIVGVSLFFLVRLSVSCKPSVVNFEPFLLFLILFMLSCFGFFFGSVGFNASRFLVFICFLIMLVFWSVKAEFFPLRESVAVFLILHCLFFYVQFLGFYGFGVYIDYLQNLGLESRNFGGNFEFPWGGILMRSSGLFSEPGTYACFLAPMVAIYFGLVHTKLDLYLSYVALFSLFLSLSTFGLVFSAVIVFFLIGTIRFKVFAGAIFGIFSAPYFYWRFIVRVDRGLDSGLGFREEYIASALSNFLSLNRFLFGHGGFGVNKFNFSSGGADNDSGLIFYILYNFGALSIVFITIFIFYFFVRFNAGKSSWVAIFILFASKISFYAMAFPLYLFIIFVGLKSTRLSRI